MMQVPQSTPIRAALAGLGILAVSGCGGDLVAPDSLTEKPGIEGFYNQIATACGHQKFGNQPLNYIINISNGDDNDYVLDETSKLYDGRIDRTTYANDINGFFPTETNTPALNCIYAQLNQASP